MRVTKEEIVSILREHGPLTAAGIDRIRYDARLARMSPRWRDRTWVQVLLALGYGTTGLYPVLRELETSGRIGSRWMDPVPGSEYRRREYFLVGPLRCM